MLEKGPSLFRGLAGATRLRRGSPFQPLPRALAEERTEGRVPDCSGPSSEKGWLSLKVQDRVCPSGDLQSLAGSKISFWASFPSPGLAVPNGAPEGPNSFGECPLERGGHFSDGNRKDTEISWVKKSEHWDFSRSGISIAWENSSTIAALSLLALQWVFLCRRKTAERLKHLLQVSQWYGFSPVCVLICLCKSPDPAKHFPVK